MSDVIEQLRRYGEVVEHTYGPVQFAVPAERPVYDDGRCYDPPTHGVHLTPTRAAQPAP